MFDGDGEEPQSKVRRYVMTGSFFVLAAAATLWYFLRFQTEKDTVNRFFEQVSRGDLKAAYALWKPADPKAYPFEEFEKDWGPQGYYGPVRSFRVTIASRKNRTASGVIVAVELCPETPFRNDPARNKEVKLWVERSDQSLSFPP
ncbi:MAG: hypothetical protein HY046_09745 [Acidobacteria bacterium]|nr:hypothetical protein [Acidobacteriota bacterium]